jgi:hypothetical protein
MAKIQAFVTIGVLVTLSSEAAIAMSPQEIPAEVKSCKAITDDKERLRCFDSLFGSPYAKDRNGNLILIGTIPLPHSKDKRSPRERQDKRHLVRQGATIFKKELLSSPSSSR